MAYAKYLEKYSTTLRVGVSAGRGHSITASGGQATEVEKLPVGGVEETA